MRLFLFSIILCIPFVLQAQSFDADFPTPTITLSPLQPQPLTEVTASLTPLSETLTQSSIQWYRNNVMFAEGVGATSATTTSPRSGEEVIIRAMIDSNPPRVASFSLQPGTVSLLWSAHTYTPPFYKGRALPTRTSPLTVEAVPELYKGSKKIPVAELVFTWSINGSVVKKVSGVGRAQVTFPPSFEEVRTVGVVARSKDGSVGAEAIEPLTATEPQVQLYRVHPLFGTLFHSAIPSEYITNETDIQFMSVPFFANSVRPQLLSYEWSINDGPAAINTMLPHRIHITSAGAERATLAVILSNAFATLEHVTREWVLYLGEKTIPSRL